MEYIFRYYGVDWLLFVFVFVHIWLLAERRRVAFLAGIAACFCGATFGTMTGSVATIIMNTVFAFLHFRAWIKWGKN